MKQPPKLPKLSLNACLPLLIFVLTGVLGILISATPAYRVSHVGVYGMLGIVATLTMFYLAKGDK